MPPLGAKLTIKAAAPGLNPLHNCTIKLDDYEVKGLRFLELTMDDHTVPICRMDFIVGEFDCELGVLTELKAKLAAWKAEAERQRHDDQTLALEAEAEAERLKVERRDATIEARGEDR